MVSIRMIGLAVAFAIFLPTLAYALPTLWPGNDPTTLVVEGGAGQYAHVHNVTLFNPPPETTPAPDSQLGEEQLVEGHTTFVTITMEPEILNNTGTVDVTAIVNCTFQTGVDTWDPGVGDPVVPYGVHSSTLACLENATLVAMPNPIPGAAVAIPHMAPDGVVIAFTTPTGESGYETEYSYVVGGATRYAWAVQPIRTPFLDEHGVLKNLYVSMPVDKLAAMGVRDFQIIDARQLAASS